MYKMYAWEVVSQVIKNKKLVEKQGTLEPYAEDFL